ncbi:hypothetical protein [Macrococcoides caseolyticum]|uniref:hypothetical protein n=1 Tax=Macrococcoides caseolyticum TaxID=69966 RepID=UPI001F2740E1|nr:hypothetical protein [Macrococcus caseolyticus]MCE4957325.1 hypothetical protein [Macrococcus caseolyticus]
MFSYFSLFFFLFQYKILGRTAYFHPKHPVSDQRKQIGNKAYAHAFEYLIGILFVFSLLKVLQIDSNQKIDIFTDIPEVIYLAATLLVLIYHYIKENKNFL